MQSGKGITASTFREIVRRRIEAAGIVPGHRRLTSHALRYSRATHAYAATKDLIAVSRQLRHKSTAVTEGYIRLGPLSAVAKEMNRALPWNRMARLDISAPDPADFKEG